MNGIFDNCPTKLGNGIDLFEILTCSMFLSTDQIVSAAFIFLCNVPSNIQIFSVFNFIDKKLVKIFTSNCLGVYVDERVICTSKSVILKLKKFSNKFQKNAILILF